MDYTYGEELPLDAVAPLFASAARASSSSHQQLAGSVQAGSASASKISMQVKDGQKGKEEDELEEGELLEDGEISEESSDEAELVAASLIAHAHGAKNLEGPNTSQSLPPDWIQRLQPQEDSSRALSASGSRLPGLSDQGKTGSSSANQRTFLDLSCFSTA